MIMKATIMLLLASFFCLSTHAQIWEWTHPEPNGPDPAVSESDDAYHVKTDAAGNVYVLGNYIHSLYLNSSYVAYGNGSYLAKYDPTGTLLWFKTISPDDATFANEYSPINATDLVVNNSGVYITGKYFPTKGYYDIYHNCNQIVTTSKTYKIGEYSFTSDLFEIGLFVCKLDGEGKVIWNKTAKDSYADVQTNNCQTHDFCSNCGSVVGGNPILALDPSNNLSIAFSYQSSHKGFVFDGTAINTETSALSGQGSEIIIINLNTNGNIQWSKTAYAFLQYDPVIGSYYGNIDCNSMIADNNGNIFLSGKATDGAIFGSSIYQFTRQPNELTVDPTYIAKLSPGGIWQFVKMLATYSVVNVDGENSNNVLTVDNNNNIYSVLTVQSSPYGNSRYILGDQIYPGFMNPYLVKMDNNCSLIWWKSFGTNSDARSDNYGTGIALQNNSLYITGAIRGYYPYNNFSYLSVPSTNTNGTLEYVVAKADLDGNFQWATRFSGGSNVGGFSVAAFADNIYTTGYYRVSITTLGLLGGNFTNNDIYTHQIFFGKLKDQYIKVGAISPTTLCPGSTFIIPFTSDGLLLSSTNTFTAQLSDANGNFTNASNIGSTSSMGSGSITAILPANLSMGTSGYKVRIVSSDLLNTGLPYYAYADINYSITAGNQTFYADADGDEYGNTAIATQACTAPQGYVAISGDCNDNDNSVHPNAPEVCDGKDNDCNGQVDEGLPSFTYYLDADADGFGDASASIITCSPTAPTGFVSNSSDCDDTKKLYQDNDHDGYGSITLVACGGVLVNTDCNDNNVNIHPSLSEICGNGIDDNCDGQIDENCVTNTLPTINIQDKTISEAQGVVALTVSLSKASTQSIKINYATVDGTATSKGKSKDFTSTKGSLTIPAGTTSGTISIAINNDGIAEPSEYFDVDLSLAKNVPATIFTSTARVTILDGVGAATIFLKSISTNNSSEEFNVIASPNPSSGSFNLNLKSTNNKPFSIIVTDVLGRTIESRFAVVSNSNLQFGNNYRQGIYYVKIIQGDKKQIIKLLKVH
jgi:hypothetical protein